MLGEIAVEIRHELVERNGKARGGVERGDIGDVALDQNDTRVAQSHQRALEDLRQLGIQIFPEMAARHPEAQAREIGGRDRGHATGHNAVEQHTHRRRCAPSGPRCHVRDRHDARS